MSNQKMMIQDFFTKSKKSNESDFLYFYTIKKGKNYLIGISDKRVFIVNIHSLSLEILSTEDIILNNISNITVKRGYFKTKITLQTENERIVYKVRNICIGLSEHRNNLIQLNTIYNKH